MSNEGYHFLDKDDLESGSVGSSSRSRTIRSQAGEGPFSGESRSPSYEFGSGGNFGLGGIGGGKEISIREETKNKAKMKTKRSMDKLVR